MNNKERALHELTRPQLSRADFVSVEEAADTLKRSVRTVRYWEKAGHMPARKRFGRKLMYKRQDVNELASMIANSDA